MQEETARPAVNSPPHLTVAPLKAFIPTGECLMNLGVIFHVKKKKKMQTGENTLNTSWQNEKT